MFKLVHYVACNVAKREAGILLEYFLAMYIFVQQMLREYLKLLLEFITASNPYRRQSLARNGEVIGCFPYIEDLLGSLCP